MPRSSHRSHHSSRSTLNPTQPTHPVHELRPSSVLEAELDWFFAQAESDLGLHSNFAPLVDMLHSGLRGTPTDPSDDAEESRMEAAHAERVIRRRLEAMPSTQAGILAAAFEPRRWPEKLFAELGRLTGIAVRLTMGRVGFAKDIENRRQQEDATAAWLNGSLKREGATSLCVVRCEALGLFSGALRAYAKVRGLGPSIVPGGR